MKEETRYEKDRSGEHSWRETEKENEARQRENEDVKEETQYEKDRSGEPEQDTGAIPREENPQNR